MIILLDENLLSTKLKQPFLKKGDMVYNVNDMGWRGLKDREILDLAEKHPFDAFITADKNLPYQQNLTSRILRIIILDSRKISEILSSLPIGQSVLINDAGEMESIG